MVHSFTGQIELGFTYFFALISFWWRIGSPWWWFASLKMNDHFEKKKTIDDDRSIANFDSLHRNEKKGRSIFVVVDHRVWWAHFVCGFLLFFLCVCACWTRNWQRRLVNDGVATPTLHNGAFYWVVTEFFSASTLSLVPCWLKQNSIMDGV